MTRWTFFLGIAVFVSVHQWVEADTLSYLTGKVLEQLNKLDEEFPKGAANKKCQYGIENLRDWFKEKESLCRPKRGKSRDECDDEMARNVDLMMDSLIETLQEFCKGE